MKAKDKEAALTQGQYWMLLDSLARLHIYGYVSNDLRNKIRMRIERDSKPKRTTKRKVK